MSRSTCESMDWLSSSDSWSSSSVGVLRMMPSNRGRSRAPRHNCQTLPACRKYRTPLVRRVGMTCTGSPDSALLAIRRPPRRGPVAQPGSPQRRKEDESRKRVTRNRRIATARRLGPAHPASRPAARTCTAAAAARGAAAAGGGAKPLAGPKGRARPWTASLQLTG